MLLLERPTGRPLVRGLVIDGPLTLSMLSVSFLRELSFCVFVFPSVAAAAEWIYNVAETQPTGGEWGSNDFQLPAARRRSRFDFYTVRKTNCRVQQNLTFQNPSGDLFNSADQSRTRLTLQRHQTSKSPNRRHV